MNHKVGAFCELIDFLHRSHLRWLRDRDPSTKGKLRELYGRVSETLKVVDKRRLEVLLREIREGGSVDFLSKGAFLFLVPPKNESVLLPVLSLNCDFRKSELRIRMALFTFDESGQPVAIGFRFETPEGEGQHNYHHAQFITSFGTEDFLPTPRWLPTSQPALMMSAKNPYSLFLGVLIGLYGLGYIDEIWRKNRFRFIEHLREDLAQLKSGCGVPS